MALRVRGLQRGELDGFLTCFQAAFGVDDQSLAVVRNSLVNDPYFQHRGFGTKVMQDAMRLVRQRGYELAMLTTRVPGFFVRLGFKEVPKVDGYECPATALAKVSIPEPCAIQKLDYEHDWPALAAIYHEYSQARTGMQVRDLRSWETWPRRGTFPHGFSSHLDACGLVGVVNGQNVAYLAAHIPIEPRQLSVTDLAYLPGHEQAALTLLREVAEQFLESGSGRTVLHIGGEAPLLKLLEQQRVPLQAEIGPGLMVLIPNDGWVRGAGFRSSDDAIDHLFRSPVPTLWHRDGY